MAEFKYPDVFAFQLKYPLNMGLVDQPQADGMVITPGGEPMAVG